MVIDPALDVWVWITAAVFLGVLGARAWVVETGQRQLGGTPTRVRTLTLVAGVVLTVLLVLFMTQAGALLLRSLTTGTDPISLIGGTDGEPTPGGQQGGDGQQAPADQPPAPDGAAPAAPAGG
jgi:hypothetical protein